jgi:hypothetical protein
MNSDDQIYDFIKEHYQKYLERDPDSEGLEYYFFQIRHNKIKPKDLGSILQQSDEYKRKIEEKELPEIISSELEKILNDFQPIDELDIKESEPTVFVSCYNGKNDFGGVYFLSENKLQTIFEGSGCFGIFFDTNHDVLFVATRTTPQIMAYKKERNIFSRISVDFSNYIFGEQSHGITIFNGKLIVIATDGTENEESALNLDVPWKGIGKIIVSDLEFGDNSITIKNSQSYNPFSCNHHHHINDICVHNNSLYLLSHSYCDLEKNYIKKGVLSILSDAFQATPLLDKFQHPHSLHSFHNRLFLCSSGIACIMSISLPERIKLEYKGIDSYTRGLAVTKNFMYFGNSFSIGRTNSKFTNPIFGLLKFNRQTGITDFFPLPKGCDNVYAVIY